MNTAQSTWEVPEDLAWRELMSKEDGKTFWHNAKTVRAGATQVAFSNLGCIQLSTR